MYGKGQRAYADKLFHDRNKNGKILKKEIIKNIDESYKKGFIMRAEFKMKHIFFLATPVALFFSSYSFADKMPSIDTSVEKGVCSISVGGIEVENYSCASSRAPALLSYSYLYELGGSVMVFIDKPMGNACDGGPLHIINQDDNGKYKKLSTIDFCGGHYPAIISEPTKLTIKIPSIIGEGGRENIPSEKWILKDGELTKNSAELH